jgi:hypothetical protein
MGQTDGSNPHPVGILRDRPHGTVSQDKGKGRVALSTKTLEQEPGDMIKNQGKVFEHAEETAAKYQVTHPHDPPTTPPAPSR